MRNRLLAALVAIAFMSGTVSRGDELPWLAAAVDLACSVDVRGALVGPIQHGEDEVDDLILESTADWVPRFNLFATSEYAAVLRSFAEGAHRSGAEAYTPAACSVLAPLYAAAIGAPIVASAGATVETGFLLDHCGDDLCVPASIGLIGDRCNVTSLEIPLSQPCAERQK